MKPYDAPVQPSLKVFWNYPPYVPSHSCLQSAHSFATVLWRKSTRSSGDFVNEKEREYAFGAVCPPFSLSLASYQPQNKLLRFHSLSPCRTITIRCCRVILKIWAGGGRSLNTDYRAWQVFSQAITPFWKDSCDQRAPEKAAWFSKGKYTRKRPHCAYNRTFLNFAPFTHPRDCYT